MEYEELISKVAQFESFEFIDEAVEILNKMKQIFPDKLIEIEQKKIELIFRQERYEEALREAIDFMPNDDGKIYHWVLENYYYPFKEESEALWQTNIEQLTQYEYYYGPTGVNLVKTLLYDGFEKIIYCKNGEIYNGVGVPTLEIQKSQVVLVKNMFNIDLLSDILHKTKYDGKIPYYDIPMYLYYDKDYFYALAQCIDFKQLLIDKRAVIIVGQEHLEDFFRREQIKFPERIIGQHIEEIKEMIDALINEKEAQLRAKRVQI